MLAPCSARATGRRTRRERSPLRRPCGWRWRRRLWRRRCCRPSRRRCRRHTSPSSCRSVPRATPCHPILPPSPPPLAITPYRHLSPPPLTFTSYRHLLRSTSRRTRCAARHCCAGLTTRGSSRPLFSWLAHPNSNPNPDPDPNRYPNPNPDQDGPFQIRAVAERAGTPQLLAAAAAAALTTDGALSTTGATEPPAAAATAAAAAPPPAVERAASREAEWRVPPPEEAAKAAASQSPTAHGAPNEGAPSRLERPRPQP